VTDFLADLEAELVEAARRRGAHRRLPRPRAGLVVRFALAAAVVAALLVAVALLGRPDTGRDHGAAPPAGHNTVVPGSVAARGQLLHACAAQARSLPVGEVPGVLMRQFGVLRRRQTEADPLPEVPEISRWLPVGAYDPSAVRRLGPLSGARTRPVYVVPTSDLRTGPMACSRAGSIGPGLCLVAGTSSTPVIWGCFRAADALAGRAAIREAGGPGARLHVLAPDGTRSVTVAQGSQGWDVGVAANLAQRYLPLRAEGVRLTLVGDATGCGIRVDPRLAQAIAALRAPAGAARPASLASALEGGRIAASAARVAASGGGVTWWVVPAAFPGDTPCAPLRRACVIPVTDHPVGAPACAVVGEERFGGSVIAGPYSGQVAIYGIVAPRVAAVRVTIDRQTHTVAASRGVVAGVAVLPWHNGSGVRFTYVPGPGAPVVAVLDGSGHPGRATSTARQLRGQAFRTGVIGTLAPRTRTSVLFSPGHQADAQAVARVLRIPVVAPLDAAARAALTGSGPLPDAAVALGQRMR
jgi:hypothetical protein